MAVAKKEAAPATQTKSASQRNDLPIVPEGLLKKGAIVNLDKGGRTLTGYEVLDFDDRVVKFRGSVLNSPQTEIVLIPWEKIEAIGLVGAYG